MTFVLAHSFAQALGSSWNGQRIGATGDFVSFSFQANKNVTCSEGGCLVLNTAEEARLAEKYRLQGVTRNGFGNQLASFEAELDLADSSSDIKNGSGATQVDSEFQGITATAPKISEITPTSGFGSQTLNSAAPRTRHLRVAFIRAPRITEVGDEVRVLASYEGEAVVVEYRNLLAATCHPEITGETQLHARFLDLVL